jgi:hypothetical protein
MVEDMTTAFRVSKSGNCTINLPEGACYDFVIGHTGRRLNWLGT